MNEVLKKLFKDFIKGLGAGLIFYWILVLIGWGSNSTGSYVVADPSIAIIATFALAWFHYMQVFRKSKTWDCPMSSAIGFLMMGTLIIWQGCSAFDREGLYDIFERSWGGLAISATLVFGAAGVALIPALIQQYIHALRGKSLRL